MAWPDLSRKLWSYIITKIGLFTNVDATKLELGSNKLSLNDVELDTRKIEPQGITISQCVIGKLSLELNSSGFTVNARGLRAKAKINSFESPDLAISVILQNTKTDLAALGKQEAPEASKSQPGLVAKLADMALAQLSVSVSHINICLELGDDTFVNAYISETFMSSKHRIEFECITLSAHDGLGSFSSLPRGNEHEGEPEEDQEHDSEPEEDDNEFESDYMSQSIYLDANSSFRNLSSERSAPPPLPSAGTSSHRSSSEGASTLALIDRVIFTYDLDPVKFSIEIDRSRVDGFNALETLVSVLNLVFSGYYRQLGQNESENEPKAQASFNLHTLEIYESLENASVPITLRGFELKSKRLTIAALDIPQILHVCPFLTLDAESPANIEIAIQAPVSAHFSPQLLSYVQELTARTITILKVLEPPENTEPTPFTLELPEIRFSVGESMTLYLFPISGSEKVIKFREITAIVGDNQLALSSVNLYIQKKHGIAIQSTKLKISESLVDDLKLLERSLFSDQSSPPSIVPENLNIDEEQLTNFTDFAFDLAHIHVSLMGKNSLLSGTLKGNLSSKRSELEGQISGTHAGSELELILNASSRDGLKSIDATARCRKLKLICDTLFSMPAGNNAEFPLSSAKRDAYNQKKTGFTTVNLEVLFENTVECRLETDTALFLSIDRSEVTIKPAEVSINLPRIHCELKDPTSPQSTELIPIFTIEKSKLTRGESTKLEIGNIRYSTCADTNNFINDTISKLTPEHIPLEFKTEPRQSIDVFEKISNSEFIPARLKPNEDFLEKSVLNQSTATLKNLDIQENYIGNQRSKLNKIPETNADELRVNIPWREDANDFELRIRRVQWLVHDGFDFKNTRQKVEEAIKRVKNVADKLETGKKTEEDPSVLGDFMYNSVLITVPASRADALRKSIADEMGGSMRRSESPKVALTLLDTNVITRSSKPHPEHTHRSQFQLFIKDGRVSDNIPTSRYHYMVKPVDVASKENLISLTTDTVGPSYAPEARSKVQVKPLHLSLDQDTVEFTARFFQFTNEDQSGTNAEAKQDEEPSSFAQPTPPNSTTFFQRFEFSGLPMIIDYTPKKLDYRSLRSGMAAELINIFAVKGAKLTLKAAIMHGVDGWDQLFSELGDRWMPDIRENQLLGLVSGLNPVRRAVKVSKGVGNYTINPIKQKQITKGAGVVVRRTIDELLGMGSSWMDSTDKALSGG